MATCQVCVNNHDLHLKYIPMITSHHDKIQLELIKKKTSKSFKWDVYNFTNFPKGAPWF